MLHKSQSNPSYPLHVKQKILQKARNTHKSRIRLWPSATLEKQRIDRGLEGKWILPKPSCKAADSLALTILCSISLLHAPSFLGMAAGSRMQVSLFQVSYPPALCLPVPFPSSDFLLSQPTCTRRFEIKTTSYFVFTLVDSWSHSLLSRCAKFNLCTSLNKPAKCDLPRFLKKRSWWLSCTTCHLSIASRSGHQHPSAEIMSCTSDVARSPDRRLCADRPRSRFQW